jgi:hypothetical protein
MQLTKKKTAILALALIAVFLCGFASAWFLKPTTITVTVEEAIEISPSDVPITMYPEETKTAEFTITNKASNPISLRIDVHCLNETYAEFFDVTYESPFTANPGDNPYQVSITANQSIPPTPEGAVIVFEVTWER